MPRKITAKVIDIRAENSIWWRLTDEQRKELSAFCKRHYAPPGVHRVEYVPGHKPALRITNTVKDANRVSQLDPSCHCGTNGRPNHLWELTDVYPLTEPLPSWWQPTGKASR